MKIAIKQIKAEATYFLRHTVMWPDMPKNYIILPNDGEGTHFGLFVNNVLTSVVSLFIDYKVAQFRKLATATAEQGKGYASILLTHVMAYAERKKVNRIWCNARMDKKEFYLKFGLHSTHTTFTKGEIDYVVMEKILIY